MDDKEIKQILKDASLWLADASKRWPKERQIAANRFNGAWALMAMLKRTMEEARDNDRE